MAGAGCGGGGGLGGLGSGVCWGWGTPAPPQQALAPGRRVCCPRFAGRFRWLRGGWPWRGLRAPSSHPPLVIGNGTKMFKTGSPGLASCCWQPHARPFPCGHFRCQPGPAVCASRIRLGVLPVTVAGSARLSSDRAVLGQPFAEPGSPGALWWPRDLGAFAEVDFCLCLPLSSFVLAGGPGLWQESAKKRGRALSTLAWPKRDVLCAIPGRGPHLASRLRCWPGEGS